VAETNARNVASRLGRVQELQYPWLRIERLNFGNSKLRFMNCQQESPFYFNGRIAGLGTAVFCKVWREGDHRTKRERIVEEIKYLKMANKLGVPSPKVFKELTALDIMYTSKQNETEKYHILVTQKLKQDEVAQNDVFDFALALIRAVQQLHHAGVLHCEIKPANIAWDSNKRKVYLLDFGHAQDAQGAKSYEGTLGFTAPEVTKCEPHTKASDVYSVGKTLDWIVDNSDSRHAINGPLSLVRTIARLFTKRSPILRMTLKDAEDKLSACLSTMSPLSCKMHQTDLAAVSQIKVNCLHFLITVICI